ncbi:MAG: hypothetical protein ABW082_13865 [Sedimenticola sp.]
MLDLHFLAAADGSPMTKGFSLDKAGNIIKHPYPMVKHFNSYTETVGDIEEFHNAIVTHAAQGHCLLKGQLDRPLINEPRAGHTSPNTTTRWMVLDNDYLHDISPDELMALLGLEGNYIAQYSSSAGILPDKMGYHIFYMLDKDAHPDQLKAILKNWNMAIPSISEHITLAASGVTLKWPLDISVCQNDKLIYIAPPICGEGIKDPLSNRINLIRKDAP